MNILALIPGPVWIVLVVILAIVAFLGLWKKFPQNNAGIVTGLRKRVINGGGGWVIPRLERVDTISLEAISLSVIIEDSRSSQQIPVDVNSTVVVKVKNTENSILAAGELFAGKNEDQVKQSIKEIITNVMEGKLREVIARMTVEELYQDRDKFSSTVQTTVATELETMGLEIVSFTIKDISDKDGYIASLGVKQLVERQKDAEVAKAEAKRDEALKTSTAKQEGAKAIAEAEAKISEANKERTLKQEQYRTEQETAKAQADASYQIQQNITQQRVIESQMQNELLIQEKQKAIQEAKVDIEIAQELKKQELATKQTATAKEVLRAGVIEPALAEKERQQADADARKYSQIAKAEADAEERRALSEANAAAMSLQANAEAQASKAKGLAEADVNKAIKVAEAESEKAIKLAEAEGDKAKLLAEADGIRAKGLAEAEGIKAKLLAEAEGMEKKAEAYSKYNNAAILEMVVDILPEVARSIAEPLSRIDKITIIDSGNGDSTGLDSCSNNVGAVMSRTFETLKETTGIDLKAAFDADVAGKTTQNINLTGGGEAIKEIAHEVSEIKTRK